MLRTVTSSEMAVASYAERVDQALARFMQTRMYAEMEILAAVLNGHSTSDETERLTNESIAVKTWTTVLRDHAGATMWMEYMGRFILTGLLCDNRWQAVFRCESDAHALVITIARSLRKVSLSDDDIHQYLRRCIHSVMEAWLGRSVALDFTTRDLASALFGEAWCTFVYDDCRNNLTLGQLIAKTRPPFRPCLLPSDVHRTVCELSELEC
jgi:hypothetical protein